MNWKNGKTISPLGLNRLEEAVGEMSQSYTPTVWAVGDTITAEKMNKLEQGVADALDEMVEVEALSVTENGTYSEEGKAYSPVVVDVEGDDNLEYLGAVYSYDESSGYGLITLNKSYNELLSIVNNGKIPTLNISLTNWQLVFPEASES